MKRLAAVALIVAGVVFPAFGQHGGAGHGGAGGHAGFSGHSGFSVGASSRFAGPSRFAAPSRFAPGGPMRRSPGSFGRVPSGYPGSRRAPYPGLYSRPNPGPKYGYPAQRSGDRGVGNIRDRDHRRSPYISAIGAVYPYSLGPWIWPVYPTYLDYGDDYGDDSQGAQNALTSDMEYYDNGDYDEPPQQWPALGPNAPSAYQSQAAPDSETAVTLIFKDGRRPLQIHNYALTQSTLFVGDARGVTIPIDQIDIPATEKANSDAGVDFHLPRSTN
jgi:hypothetical protein